MYTLFRTARPKNHTLSSGTSPYSPNKGVPPPPRVEIQPQTETQPRVKNRAHNLAAVLKRQSVSLIFNEINANNHEVILISLLSFFNETIGSLKVSLVRFTRKRPNIYKPCEFAGSTSKRLEESKNLRGQCLHS